VRCDACQQGTYKPAPGNGKCTDCRSLPLPLAAKEFTTTVAKGARSAIDCVCQSGYFLVTDAVSSVEACRPCSSTWYQGREGTDCSRPGVLLETLPVRPGFYRQSRTAQLVRRCINIDGLAACAGSGNETAHEDVVKQTLLLNMSLEEYAFAEASVVGQLAVLYGVAPASVQTSVTAGSVQLTITIRMGPTTSGGSGGAASAPAPPALPTTLLATSLAATINSITSSALASSLGAPVSVMSPAQPNTAVMDTVSRCNNGYGGPYCAVCAQGYYGGGEGGTCELCADAGDPTLTIAIQLGAAFLTLVLITVIMIKYGRRAAQVAVDTLESAGNEGGASANLKDTIKGNLEATVEETVEAATEDRVKPKRRLAARIARFITTFGVKVKILVSLYQVLNGLGVVFNIPYPDSYSEWLKKISAIELDLPSLLPLDCLFGGINFTHTLILQTAGPLLVIGLLEVCSWLLARTSHKTAGDNQARAARMIKPSTEGAEGEGASDGKQLPIRAFLSSLCSNVSFFLLFLLYPGTSAKIFNALLCVGFDGEGENGERFLRVDFSIDCKSTLYLGFIFPYALAMVLIYPIGVPTYYALTLFRNKAELHELRNLELSVATEASRIELGERLRGSELRAYQPEIEEAKERKRCLEETYATRRDALPGNLKKLTNGYELRTYWCEIFECFRKILLLLVPIFFEQDSPEQLTIGLILCFITFGAYMMHAPFEDSGDDFLSQICQLQIFFSLLASIVLQTNPDSGAMGVILPILIFVPPISAFIFESGALEELQKLQAFKALVNWDAATRLLERLLKVHSLPNEDEDEDDVKSAPAGAPGSGAEVAPGRNSPQGKAQGVGAAAVAAHPGCVPLGDGGSSDQATALLEEVLQREGGKEELAAALQVLSSYRAAKSALHTSTTSTSAESIEAQELETGQLKFSPFSQFSPFAFASSSSPGAQSAPEPLWVRTDFFGFFSPAREPPTEPENATAPADSARWSSSLPASLGAGVTPAPAQWQSSHTRAGTTDLTA